MADLFLQVHHFLSRSRANGPGWRAVVWVQGCTLGCPGCFNPRTHPPGGGERVGVDDLFRRIAALGDAIEGVSISGGEPLQQREPLLALLRRVRKETDLSVLLFSGYSWDEICGMPGAEDLAACVDVLVAGRYDRSRPVVDGLRSSANQAVHLFTERYTPADLQAIPPAEVVITGDGEVIISGIDPVKW